MPAELEALLKTPLGYFFAGLWGTIWGSFFNVCIHRVGLYESVVRPRSRCPRCGIAIRAVDNIPILSWLWLRGRCRGCGMRISIRYPLVEAGTALLALAIWWRFVVSADDLSVALLRFFIYFAFVGTLIVLSGLDLEHTLIPDRITYPAIPIFFILGVVLREHSPAELALGAVIGYAMTAVTIELGYAIRGSEVMGYGDAKLLAIIGALLGWHAVIVAFFVAPFVGLLVTLPIMFIGKKSFRLEIPYGPFLVAGGLAYLFVLRGIDLIELIL